MDAWKADLTAKSRPKLAESIAHPDFNTDLFEEGWADAVAKEQGKAPEPAPLNGKFVQMTAVVHFAERTAGRQASEEEEEDDEDEDEEAES